MNLFNLTATCCTVAALVCGSADAHETTNLLPSVEAQICQGRIEAESSMLHLSADWYIEWPVAVSNASSKALGIIQRQMIDDSFGPLLGEEPTQTVSRLYNDPDKALQLLFSRAYSKLNVSPEEDSYTARALDFNAYLRIRFAHAGYVGYVLEGLENEGGNGCHSYVKARVLSLATGRALIESDFMTPSGLAAFPKVFFDRITGKENAQYRVIGDVGDAAVALGNFVIEPGGIRWWLRAYSVFPGGAGVQDELMTWQELKPFLKPGKSQELKAIFARPVVQVNVKGG